MAGWHREAGLAHKFLSNFELAEFHLTESIKFLDIILPPLGMKLDWEIKREMGVRTKYDKSMMPGPISEEYNASYQEDSGVAELLDQKVFEMEDFHKRISPKFNVALSLLALAEYYLKSGQTKYLKFVILSGLNICEEMPKEGIYCRLMAINAFETFYYGSNVENATKYSKIAESYDRRTNIFDSIEIVKVNATLKFVMGEWADSKRRLDALVSLGRIAQYFSPVLTGLRFKTLLFYFGNSRTSSFGLAKELYSTAIEHGDWEGKFWGAYMIISNLLGMQTADYTSQLSEMIESFTTLWDEAPSYVKQMKSFIVCRLGLLAALNTQPGSTVNPLAQLKDFAENFEAAGSHEWITLVGCMHVYHAMMFAYERGNLLTDSESKAIFNSICDAVHSKCKGDFINTFFAQDFKHLFKGFKYLAIKKYSEVYKAWGSGTERIGHTDAFYIVGIFNASLAKYHEKKASQEKYQTEAVKIMSKIGASYEINRIWNI
jgi:hypothetical protein